jgi:malate dehydrogenase
MPKVAVIGAGFVGGLSAMRICQERLADVVLVDIAGGIAEGKGLDIEDAASLLHYDTSIKGTADFSQIKDSSVIVVTAGFARKPGETRQDLLNKNSRVIQDISSQIKKFSPQSIVIVVTNPVDVMNFQVYKNTGIDRKKVIGLGVSLDGSRFANLISKELDCRVSEVEPVLIASHNEKMMPLARFTKVKGRPLSELLSQDKISRLIQDTRNRGATIVSHLGSGSAYVAPSAAVLKMVKAILGDEKQETFASAILEGEYGASGVSLGVPVVLGRNGIEKIIDLKLNAEEKQEFLAAAEEIKLCTTSA